MTTVVFVGPTLGAHTVERFLPEAVIRPPVAVGDVLALRRVKRIAIIDGYFERMAAVWHKEILLALERGIAVYGAASMGALRAAELAPFGMIGVGRIYRDIVAGRLVADDAVAVAHLPAEYQFRATSDALVNLLHGIARAPMLTDRTREALGELARARFYRERSWDRLVADGRAAKLPERQLAAFAAWPKPDLKAMDARRLLRELSREAEVSERGQRQGKGKRANARPSVDDHRGARPKRIDVPRTWALRQLIAQRA